MRRMEERKVGRKGWRMDDLMEVDREKIQEKEDEKDWSEGRW